MMTRAARRGVPLHPMGVGGLLTLVLLAGTAPAQLREMGLDTRFELDDAVTVERADSQVASRIERAGALVADRQWDEAVQALRQIMEDSGEKLWPVSPTRFVSVADHVQRLLLELPPEALAVYRARVDSLAERWYRQGIAAHDRGPLLRIEREALASRWGDDALLALGEMALESGETALARFYWERILPIRPPSAAPTGWLATPDTDLDVASVRARLVLSSIVEGSADRAREELAELARLHPDARGRLGGREVLYVEELGRLLSESLAWPAVKTSGDWLTFAGTPQRTKIAPEAVDPVGVAWRQTLLEEPSTAGVPAPRGFPVLGRLPTGGFWPFHPVRRGQLVLVNSPRQIWALELDTGRPAWGGTAAAFRDTWQPFAVERQTSEMISPSTLTISGRWLLARMGDPVTSRTDQTPVAEAAGYLVCLDLAAQGRLVWKVAPEAEDWAFEGSPISDGARVYVGMRRSGVRPEAHVAALDLQDGRLRWRRFVCSAETPAHGVVPETTCNLLTLEGQSLFYNTNLGAVASLDGPTGRIRWLSLYPRVRSGDLANLEPFWRRSPNPCIYHQGMLIVAPSDSRRILGLDAGTGQFLWQSPEGASDTADLLGVSGNRLVAAGGRVYWIGLDRENQGKLVHVWPDGQPLRPSGRGVLAGNRVYWPAEGKVYVFDQGTSELVGTIDLAAKGAKTGNLLVAGGYLLVATDRELGALGPAGEKASEEDAQPEL